MNIVKRMFNIGLCASIQNLRINNKRIGGFNKVVVLLKPQQWKSRHYVVASSNDGDHVFREEVFLWKSKKFRTIEEVIGHLTKEVRLAQDKFPEIIFFKITEMKNYEIVSFDEFIDDRWVKSKYDWDWDPFFTMRDNFEE